MIIMATALIGGGDMLVSKKYAVYYREIPESLLKMIESDDKIKFAKDGAKKMPDGQMCPRLRITIEPTGNP